MRRATRIYPPPPGGRPSSLRRGKSNPGESFSEFEPPPLDFRSSDAMGTDLRASSFPRIFPEIVATDDSARTPRGALRHEHEDRLSSHVLGEKQEGVSGRMTRGSAAGPDESSPITSRVGLGRRFSQSCRPTPGAQRQDPRHTWRSRCLDGGQSLQLTLPSLSPASS